MEKISSGSAVGGAPACISVSSYAKSTRKTAPSPFYIWGNRGSVRALFHVTRGWHNKNEAARFVWLQSFALRWVASPHYPYPISPSMEGLSSNLGTPVSLLRCKHLRGSLNVTLNFVSWWPILDPTCSRCPVNICWMNNHKSTEVVLLLSNRGFPVAGLYVKGGQPSSLKYFS